RSTPLLYMRDGEDFVVVASNGGRRQPPAWYLNLQVEPKATVRDGRRTLGVVAETPGPEEREALWRRLHEFYAGWSHYQTLTDRELPVIRLRPQTWAPAGHMIRLLLLAPPGGGKGTQGRLLADAHGVPHVSTGDLLRDHVARSTPLGTRVRPYLE